LAWAAATDNVGVTDYRVSRSDGATTVTVDAGPATSYDDAAVTVGTTYTYTVEAYDAAGNPSPPSGPASFAPADTTAPTAPTGLTATLVAATGAHLAWTAAPDNVGVTSYQVSRISGSVTETFDAGTATTYDDSGLTPATTY